MNKLMKKNNQTSTFAKQCRICGDKASAFNFDGLSCESCKSFFRRNACRGNELECPKEGTCEITLKSRRFCPKCRLKRCFAIGMKKELLLKRKQCKTANAEEQEMNKIKSEVLNSFHNPTNRLMMNFMTESPYPSLTSYEKMKIEEVVGYYKSFKEENTLFVQDVEERLACMEGCEEYCEFVIKSVKNIPTVKNYCVDDKMIMIRNFMAIFMDLRFGFYYDVENNKGMFQDFKKDNCAVRISTDVWQEIVPEELNTTWKGTFVKNKLIMMNDPIIRDLLITLGLFRESDKISCPQVLRNHYLEYYYLLRRYMETKLKNKEKFEKQMKLFHKVLSGYPEIRDLTKRFFEVISPHYSSELMAAIYLNDC